MSEARLSFNRQPNSDHCFICGRLNPVGLKMSFYDDGHDRVTAECSVPVHFQGYPGIVHGGIVAAMLDEVVARVALIEDHHHFMMSVRLDIRYRLPIPTATPLRVEGRIERLRGRLGKAVGHIWLPGDRLAAESSMTLADVPAELIARYDPQELGWRVD